MSNWRDNVESVIAYLRNAVSDSETAREKRDADFEKWVKTRRGREPAPPVHAEILERYMLNAADSLEELIC